MKEQIKAPEKIQLSDEEIANLSDAQFKTQFKPGCSQKYLNIWWQNRGRFEGYEK